MWITLLILALAAVVGLTMARAVFQGRLPPLASAIFHGALAASRRTTVKREGPGVHLLALCSCHAAKRLPSAAAGFAFINFQRLHTGQPT